MATTLSDVAREARCSISTASRALAQSPHINLETRKRVEEAAERLGYGGVGVLRHRLRRQKTIGLVVPTVRNSHYYDDTSLLHDLLRESGYKIILCCHDNDPALDEMVLRSLIEHPVDGIIHSPTTREGAAGFLGEKLAVPVVEFSRARLEIGGIQTHAGLVDAVYADDLAAIREIVDHFALLGHRRIAMFTGRPTLYHVPRRVDAFRRAAAAHDVVLDECPTVYGSASVESSRRAMTELLKSPAPPTAVLAGSKPASIGVLQSLKIADCTIPDSISLAALTNEEWFTVTNPPLTAYETPLVEMGMVAAQMLLLRLAAESGEPRAPSVVPFSGRLIVRESTGPAPTCTFLRGLESPSGD